jgi:hypothetical protein
VLPRRFIILAANDTGAKSLVPLSLSLNVVRDYAVELADVQQGTFTFTFYPLM